MLQENPRFCKRLFGIEFADFEIILGKIQEEVNLFLEENPISNRGLDSDFSLPNRLLLTLEYLRQYPTFLSLGFSYGISESYSNKIYHRTRPLLARVAGLKNPEELKFKDVKKVLVDVTVQPIERPKVDQKKHYNRYKKNILSRFN